MLGFGSTISRSWNKFSCLCISLQRLLYYGTRVGDILHAPIIFLRPTMGLMRKLLVKQVRF